MESALLDAREVTIRFGGLVAVSDFSIEIRPRALVGLIGPNGAGKTTIFNLLTGVYRPTSGEIRFDGKNLAGQRPHRISQFGIARTFQNIRLFGDLTVLDNVRIGAQTSVRCGLVGSILRTRAWFDEEAAIKDRARDLLEIFRLGSRSADPARTLCYGDQRRLEICRALAGGPKLLLLDEPAAGMNATEAQELIETIGKIRDRFDLAVLLIEHNMEVVMGISEQIVVLNYGKTIASGPPQAIRHDPAVIAAYLGEPTEAVEGLDL